MMSNQVFSSTEELYDEASSDEALNSYHQESQMRYYENVVYVPHVFLPVMLVEYVPVFYNYLTYEPYLMNSYQVTYIPFIQQVSYSYFVPYYYSYSPPEVSLSYTPEVVLPQNEAETESNSYPESSTSDETTSDGFSSSISHSDVTSILSLSSSYSYNSDEVSVFSSTQEPCESLEGVACNENDDSYDINCVEEHSIIAREYTGGFVGADVSSEANASNLCFLLLDDENSSAVLDCSGNYLDQILLQEDHRVVSDVSSIPLFVGVEKPEDLKGSETDEACSLKDIEKAEHESHFSSERSENHVVFDDSIISNPRITNLSLLVDDEKSEDLRGSETDEVSSWKDIEKAKHDSYFSSERFENHVVFDDSSASKPHVSNLPLLVDYEKPEDLIGSKKDKASSLKDIEKAKHESYFSSERFENHVVFDDSIDSKSHASNIPLHDDNKKYEDENKLQENELSPLKNENVKQYDCHTSSLHMPASSQGISLQKPDSLDKIDVKVPDPFDYDISENDSDNDGDPAITLQDILASDENWGVKRKEYLNNRRNTELYRSALEGDIHPRRSLPEVGTLATIFEDLPYPINDPYDDGVELDQEPVKEEYFDLPPLDVEPSKSSRTTLLPKKKRFRKTKKFFSGLFRCFRPPP